MLRHSANTKIEGNEQKRKGIKSTNELEQWKKLKWAALDEIGQTNREGNLHTGSEDAQRAAHEKGNNQSSKT